MAFSVFGNSVLKPLSRGRKEEGRGTSGGGGGGGREKGERRKLSARQAREGTEWVCALTALGFCLCLLALAAPECVDCRTSEASERRRRPRKSGRPKLTHKEKGVQQLLGGIGQQHEIKGRRPVEWRRGNEKNLRKDRFVTPSPASHPEHPPTHANRMQLR